MSIQIDAEKAGPCDCSCHDSRSLLHIVACCAYCYQPRAKAEGIAQRMREGTTTEGDKQWLSSFHVEEERARVEQMIAERIERRRLLNETTE